MRTLSIVQARRVAIAAQGLARPRPGGRIDLRHARGVLDRVGLVQIDSVNVLARAHDLALFSRLGPYPDGLLGRLAYERAEAFEYWAHAASYVPVRFHPHLRHRMRRFTYEPIARVLDGAPPGFLDAVEAEIAARGPIPASALADGGRRGGPWWGWSRGKAACEALFAQGRLAVAGRRGFERLYDLSERVIPADVLALPTPDPDEADQALLLMAARACGVGTADDLADYPRVKVRRAHGLLERLADAGRLERVAVEGWPDTAYLHPEATVPHRVHACALLSPFDSLVWYRPRLERLFGFTYRIEIYVPPDSRVHGYYVLPFLLGDRMVGRVDLKADRRWRGSSQGGRLLVQHAWCEAGETPERVARALATELRAVAEWQRMGTIEVSGRGDLAAHLRAAVDGQGTSET